MNNPELASNKSNILIVDDTQENLQVLSATLSERGYKVRGVVNGKMAIRVARSACPDLILLDIKMPEMDGYQVCEALKNDRETQNIPIIFISALDEVLDKVKAFTVGGIDYITKPFQVEEVLARVENQLTIQRLQKQLMEKNERLQQEILERQKAEATALAASKAKSEFVANMSHELRTPLNAILGFTQLMNRDCSLSNEQRENLEIISRSGEHLLELIDDVLEMSKIEAGMISLNESSFDLYCLLDNIEVMLQLKAEIKGLQLIFNIASNVPQYVKTDQKKLRGCLINLLGNAIKFTDRGKITLRVNLGYDNDPNNIKVLPDKNLYFEVEDTGPGIANHELTNLFDAFVQTETGRNSMEGTGLGLAISRRYVEVMGGNITLSSVVGKGTIFKFHIKLQIANEIDAMPKPMRRVIGIEPGQKIYRILVADDRKENRKLLVKLLEPIGFQVREAENGQEAVTLWENWQPNLIFMDTRMPVKNGIEATKEIRAREISKQRGKEPHYPTPILALTASAFEERRIEILAAGSNEFIRKPFVQEIIFEKIGEYLKVRYLYEEIFPLIKYQKKGNSVGKFPARFLLDNLVVMPPSWLDDLYQAANQVNEELVVRLIEEIPGEQATLSEALTNLLQDFRLDIIVRSIELIKNSSEP
ncbi:MAG TPA: response regulator [Leptolyngbyaceae cyanobacterium]